LVELDEFAEHLSAALRIARTHPAITTRFYNDLSDAWNEFVNSVLGKGEVWESVEYMRLILENARRQQREGGAK